MVASTEAYRKRKREWARTPKEREKRRLYMAEWRNRNREKYNEWARNYHKNNGHKWRKRAVTYNRAYNARIKEEVLTHYGKEKTLTCNWPGCLVSDVDMLTIDHIENNGAQHRREMGRGGVALYCYLKQNNYPVGYQTLCANHQFKKEMLRKRALW